MKPQLGSKTKVSDGEELLFFSDGVLQMAKPVYRDALSEMLGAPISHNICGNNLQNISNARLLHVESSKYSLKNKSSIIASDKIEGIKCIK